MAFDAHKNFAVSTVASAPSPAASGTALDVAAGHGTRFPSVPFNATVWPANTAPTPANAEIVRVTSISTDTFTFTRTQESSSARSIIVGDQIAATITKKTLDDIEAGTNFPLLTSAGLLDLSAAAAGQIKFPAAQNASGNANTFDDFERGSWTPVLGGDGGTSGQTYSIQSGRYVKKANEVTAWFRVSLSAKGTITGSVQIQGLPFTIENVTSVAGAIGRWEAMGASYVFVGLEGIANTSAVNVNAATAAATAIAAITTSGITDTTTIIGVISYRATA